MLIWIISGLLAAVFIGYFALQSAIAANGPAVLDTVDRITGGSQNVERIERTSFGHTAGQKIAVYRDKDAKDAQPVLLFVHGGSWKTGDPDDYGFIGRNFASRGFTVVVSGYRMAPDHIYPAMLEDTASAIGWTHRNIARHGGDPKSIWLGGHSAGAYNVVQAVLEPRWLAGADVPPQAIAGVIGLSGPYDFYPFDSDSTKESFGQASEPEATQPINFARADAPPLLLLTGGSDTTVKPRNSKALKKAISEAGGKAEIEIYQGMDHNAPLLALASPWRDNRPVMDRILKFTADHADTAQTEAASSSLAVQAKTR